MKKLLITLFLFISLIVQAQKTYYVAANGGNNGNAGTSDSPWATLAYAVTKASATDTIFMQAGTHIINATVNVPVGISIKGAGETSIITCNSTYGAYGSILSLSSGSEAYGNQSISYLKFDGNALKGNLAINPARRHRVKIHHCTFIDFNYCGIYWVGLEMSEFIPPTTYLTGSEFYNNTITNCAEFGFGALHVGGMVGMLIYNNIITCIGRSAGSNGLPIKLWNNSGWMRGVKIYNNTLLKEDLTNWDFAIEGLNIIGAEIYNNTITGSIDLNRVSKDTYEYGVYIHNNTLGPETSMAKYFYGIILEWRTSDVIIKYNKFRNLSTGIYYTPRSDLINNHEISYNIFENLGRGDYGWSAIKMWEDTELYTIGHVDIYNNVFSAHDSNSCAFGIGIGGFADGEEVNVINNIFVNFKNYAITLKSLNNLTSLNIKNNIYYNNGNSNTLNATGTPINYINSGNIIDNPDFYSESNFHLKSGSPAIWGGMYIPELSYDLDSIKIGNPPNIGCFETIADLANPSFVSASIEDNDPELLIINYDMPLIQIIPDKSFFEVNLNSKKIPITAVAIRNGKVQITLGSPVSFGNIITLSYRIPTEKPLQSVTNINANSITNIIVTNNVKSKDTGNSPFLIFNIYPNPMKDSFTIKIIGEVPASATVLRISGLNGVIVFESPYSSAMPNFLFYVNLNPGIYVAQMLSDDIILGACKFVVII